MKQKPKCKLCVLESQIMGDGRHLYPAVRADLCGTHDNRRIKHGMRYAIRVPGFVPEYLYEGVSVLEAKGDGKPIAPVLPPTLW